MPPSLLRIIGYNAIYKYIDTFHKYLSLYTVYIYYCICLYTFRHTISVTMQDLQGL